jgi:hypothetical protein
VTADHCPYIRGHEWAEEGKTHFGLDGRLSVIAMGKKKTTTASRHDHSHIDDHSGDYRGRHETHRAGDRDRKMSRMDDHH